MKKPDRFKGLIFIIIGILIAGRVFGIFAFKLMFPGWWTLFIILPNLISFCNSEASREERSNNFFWFSIGIFLLLRCMKMLSMKLIFPLIVADLFICNGIKNMLPDKEKERMERMKKGKIKYYYGEDNQNYYEDNYNMPETKYEQPVSINVGDYTIDEQPSKDIVQTTERIPVHDKVNLTAILSGKDLKLGREIFNGGNVNAVLGGIDIDLRNAIIRNDIRINVNVLLGGVDIKLPENVRVVLTTTDILGGSSVSRKRTKAMQDFDENVPTVYIGGSCVLGGIDII